MILAQEWDSSSITKFTQRNCMHRSKLSNGRLGLRKIIHFLFRHASVEQKESIKTVSFKTNAVYCFLSFSWFPCFPCFMASLDCKISNLFSPVWKSASVSRNENTINPTNRVQNELKFSKTFQYKRLTDIEPFNTKIYVNYHLWNWLMKKTGIFVLQMMIGSKIHLQIWTP